MATKFQKGQTVRLDKTVPQGTIEKLRMDENGNFFYLWCSGPKRMAKLRLVGLQRTSL
jgi:hypothetical protein